MRHNCLTFMLFMLMSSAASVTLAYDAYIDGVYYNFYDTRATVTNYSGINQSDYSGIVTIPESVTYNGITYNVSHIGDYAFRRCSGLISVSIPNSVTYIGESAFAGCSSLTSIKIPDSVTSIDEGAFAGCSGLTSAQIGNNVTRIEEGAFSGCSSLIFLIIPNSVTRIDAGAFSDCSSLTSVYIGCGVTQMGESVFSGCTKLTSLTINCPIIGTWFNDNTSIKELVIGENVNHICSSAFKNCSEITSVTIGNKLVSIGNDAFAGCTKLTKAKFSSLESLCGMQFSNAQANPLSLARHLYIGDEEVTDLSIPDNITVIGNYTFYNGGELKTVIIPQSVTTIGEDAFSGCIGLTKAEYTSIESLCEIQFGNAQANPLSLARHLYIEKMEVTDMVIPESVNSIKEYTFYNCEGLKSTTIPNNVKSISESAFDGCTNLEKVILDCETIGTWFNGLPCIREITLENHVQTCMANAFSNCTNLTSVIINSNVIASGSYSISSTLTNIFGSQITKYSFGNDVQSIGKYLCYNCSNLTGVCIGNNVTSISNYAFEGCNSLIKAEFASIESLCSIKFGTLYANPLYYAHHLYIEGSEVTELIIPNSVETIGNYTFRYCSSLTSVYIPNCVTSIGSSAFQDCTNITSVTINSNAITSKAYTSSSNLSNIFGSQVKNYIFGDGVKSIGKYVCYNCTNLTDISIGERVTDIGEFAFYGCKGLTLISIPSSITNIGNSAFYGCSGLSKVEFASLERLCSMKFGNAQANPLALVQHLFFGDEEATEITIPENVSSIGDYAFYNCQGLTSVFIPNHVTSIGGSSFAGCKNLAKVTIDCDNVGKWFYGLSGIRDIILGNHVRTIDGSAFFRCDNFESAIIGDNIISIGDGAFPNQNLFVNRGTSSLLALWNAGYRAPYQKGTENKLLPTSLSIVETTQMTTTVKVNNLYDDMDNTLNDNIIKESGQYIFHARPEYSQTATLKVSKGGVVYSHPLTYRTLNISPTAARVQGTASSMTVKASYLEGDAEVTSQTLTVNGVTVEGDSLYLNGLKPNTTYKATYTIMVNNEYEYTKTVDLKTDAMAFVNEQPKVISEGNVIIGATSNLDWDETNVGFQWRRTDWTDDFDSNEAGAYQFEGKIEGYIRNMNTTYLWKFRPYYESADGTRFYGNWLGIDPTNTSYFEPTVHTYANITVEGNSAGVKGYAQRGTDNVVSQGFVYWKASPQPSPAGREKAPAIPSGAQKVEATGTVMEASLTGLEYESTYSYVAYVTTSEGETFYGEEKMFTTGENPDGIEAIDNGQLTMDNAKGVYDLSGRRMNVNDNDNLNSKFEIQNSKLRKGIYIVNGKKVLVK